MTDAELELARKLAAHDEWVWMDGMRFFDSGLMDAHFSRAGRVGRDREIERSYPDLADPATQGCLWAMLDEAAPGWNGWMAYLHMEPPTPRGEALARALLATWGEAKE
jgi:hypothetical protein